MAVASMWSSWRVRQRVFHSGGAEDGQEVFCAEADLLEEAQEKCFMFNKV